MPYKTPKMTPKAASRARAKGKANAQTRRQLMNPGSVTEAGTAAYAVAKLVGAVVKNVAKGSAKSSAKAKTPSSSAAKARTPGRPPTLYHGTSWKYKKGDVTKSQSASRSYQVAKDYSTRNRAGRGPWFGGKTPDPAASGKPAVYKVTPALGRGARYQNKEGSKQEYRPVGGGGYKIVKKVKSAPKPKMRTPAKPNPKPRKGNQR